MTTGTLTRAADPAAEAAGAGVGPVGRHRRWRLLAGVLVVAASAVGFVAFNVAATDTTAVLMVARPVPIGQPLVAADVQVVDVRLAPGVAAVPAEQAGQVVGRPAAVGLSPGALLAPGQVGEAAVPSAGEVLVAVRVALPPAGLAPGSRVRVLVTPSGAPAAAGAGGQPVVLASAAATVVELGPADGNGARVVSLLLRAVDGEPVATAAATGQVVLIVQAGTG